MYPNAKPALVPAGSDAVTEELEPGSLWDVRRAARYLSKSTTWVYREAEGGRLPFRRVGRTLRFIPAELRAWVHSQPGHNS